MTRHNKVRYQSKPKPRVTIELTGDVYLMYRDEETIAVAKKGDLMLYPYNEALQTIRQGEYDEKGFSGYFKVDVYDGREWRLVLLNDIFPKREHHFSKTERPIDTYGLCEDILRRMAGTTLVRTYREHYTPDEGTITE
jgi:hypothetical protein